jgi:hypothetical protein
MPAGAGGIIGTLNEFFSAKIAESFSLSFLYFVFPLLFAGFGIVLIFASSDIPLRHLWRPLRSAPGLVSGIAGFASVLSFRRKARAEDEDAYDEEEDDDAYEEFDDEEDDADAEEEPSSLRIAPEPFAPRNAEKERRVRRSEKKAAAKTA